MKQKRQSVWRKKEGTHFPLYAACVPRIGDNVAYNLRKRSERKVRSH